MILVAVRDVDRIQPTEVVPLGDRNRPWIPLVAIGGTSPPRVAEQAQPTLPNQKCRVADEVDAHRRRPYQRAISTGKACARSRSSRVTRRMPCSIAVA